MERITVYQKPTCTTCRQVYKALTEAGVDFDAVDYYVDPLSKVQLRSLLKLLNIPARELLRTNEELYRRLHLADKNLTQEEILDLLVNYPDLLQRPIVVKGSKAILARPAERIKELF
jgi:arsenate reductase